MSHLQILQFLCHKIHIAEEVIALSLADRVKEFLPFRVVGINFLGPLFTEERLEKYYVLVHVYGNLYYSLRDSIKS